MLSEEKARRVIQFIELVILRTPPRHAECERSLMKQKKMEERL